MNAELFAMTIEPLLHKLIRDTGLKLSFNLLLNPEGSIPVLTAEFQGDDVALLLSNNAEVLLAFEHIAVKMLRLEPEHHDLVSFDAANFKQSRADSLSAAAMQAATDVKRSRTPYHFHPMTSRERRLLHLALAPYGLHVESQGEGRLRHIVVRISD